MICKKCNTQLPEGVRFCFQCGEPQGNEAPTPPQPTTPPAPIMQQYPQLEPSQQSTPRDLPVTNNNPDRKPSSSKWNFLIVGGTAIVVLAFAVIGSLFLLKDKNLLQTTDSQIAHSENMESQKETKSSTKNAQDSTQEIPTETPEPSPIPFKDKILLLNETNHAIGEIDIYKNNYSVQKSKKGYCWDKRLFEGLEGTGEQWKNAPWLDTYVREAKTLRNKDTGNMIEYVLYRNPENNKVNKIVSIEVLGNGEIETVDYYFSDEGKINFIFFHTVTEYTPSYATQDKPGERYYFVEDAMTKWRIVTKQNGKINKHTYVTTKAELEGFEKDKTWSMLQKASTEIQDEFNQKAVRMLNAAYNTYYAVVNTESVNLIDGFVINEDNERIPNASVRLFIDETEDCLFECFTDENGKYQLYIPSDDYSYHLEIKKEDYLSEILYGIEPTKEIVQLAQENVCLFRDGAGGTMYFSLRHAFKNEYLSDATIYIRKGINNRIGELYDTFYYNEYDNTDIRLTPGNYTLEIVTDEFQTAYKNIRFSLENCITILLSPTLNQGEVRIVLDWGYEPNDLDSHLFTPYNRKNSEDVYHIWYGNSTDPYGNNLDIDDTDGYGPETMTIKDLGTGCYKYYVADFTHCINGDPWSYAMSESGAQVNVYTWNGDVEAFYVPANRSGVIWEVFEIRNGKINRINHYYNQIEDKQWWHQEK